MAITKDSYDAATTSSTQLNSATYQAAQSFLAGSSYTITSAKMKLWIDSAVDWTITMAVYASDPADSYKPTGAALCSGTKSSLAFSTAAHGTYEEFDFGDGTPLTAGVTYCLVISTSGGAPGGYVQVGRETVNGYPNGDKFVSTDTGSSWTPDAASDYPFATYTDKAIPADRTYTRQLVAIGNQEVWYQSSVDTMEELTDANADIDATLPLEFCEAYEKIFIANGTNLKVADFGNDKLSTADIAGGDPPDKGNILTGGTSAATMVVDYISSLTGACLVYGKRTSTAPFVTGETVTGTDNDGNAISFVLDAAPVAPPHWYNWTVYGGDATGYGAMPASATLVCLYRGRATLAGNSQYPFQWYMPRQADPWDFLYTANDAQSPVAGGNSDAGEVGDVVKALIPYKDDYLVFGCASTMWYMVGDPAFGGSLNELSLTTGIMGAKAWCWDSQENLYFLGTTGLFRIPAGFGGMENLTFLSYPSFITDLAFNSDDHRITLAYDRINHGIVICKTTVATGANSNWFYDLRTEGLFPESYPTACGVFSAHFYDADDPSYRKLLFGGNDGYIRCFDLADKSDDAGASDVAISSYVVLGPIKLSEEGQGIITNLRLVTGGGASGGSESDSHDVTYQIWVADTAEEAIEKASAGTNPQIAGVISAPGYRRGNRMRKKLKGAYAVIKLLNSTAAQS